MIRKFTTAIVLCAVLTLQGCQPPTETFLLNNSGATLEVLNSVSQWRDQNGQVQTRAWRRGWLHWPFLIDNGVGRKVKPGAVWHWILDVRIGRCRLHFEAPMQMLYEQEGWFAFHPYRYHQTVQIERDGRLHLVAADTTDTSLVRTVDVAPFADLQPEGFPVEPTSRTCR